MRTSAMSRPIVTIRQAGVDDIPLILDFIRKKAEFDGALHTVRATREALQRALFADPPTASVIRTPRALAGRPLCRCRDAKPGRRQGDPHLPRSPRHVEGLRAGRV